MWITLIADEETAGTLTGKLSQDPFFLSEGPVERAAFILFYDSNTVEYLTAGFGPERRDTLADIHPAATRTLRGVVQNTWLDNREDQLSEPLAAIIQCDLKARTATVTYHLGDDSEAWRFNDDNFRELLAALARSRERRMFVGESNAHDTACRRRDSRDPRRENRQRP